MKKLIFLLIFVPGYCLAQNFDIGNKDSCRKLLCSKTWVRYQIIDRRNNPHWSDTIIDSIVFYSNGTFYKANRIAGMDDYLRSEPPCKGKWSLGNLKYTIYSQYGSYPSPTGKGNDTLPDSILLEMGYNPNPHSDSEIGYCFELTDPLRLKKYNRPILTKPFIQWSCGGQSATLVDYVQKK